MKKIRVLLADDHHLVREGIRALLESDPVIEVAGEASDGLRAIEMARSKRPDVVLLDIGMHTLNGLDAAARITKEIEGVKVIILSMHVNEEYVLRAMRAGASGYLLKDGKKDELLFAVKSVFEGKTYLSPMVSKHVIDSYVKSVGAETSPLDLLTPRQREILRLIADGKTNKEIAQSLSISVKTVDTHRTQLMERLDIHDVAGLVRFAIREGLVQLNRE